MPSSPLWCIISEHIFHTWRQHRHSFFSFFTSTRWEILSFTSIIYITIQSWHYQNVANYLLHLFAGQWESERITDDGKTNEMQSLLKYNRITRRQRKNFVGVCEGGKKTCLQTFSEYVFRMIKKNYLSREYQSQSFPFYFYQSLLVWFTRDFKIINCRNLTG